MRLIFLALTVVLLKATTACAASSDGPGMVIEIDDEGRVGVTWNDYLGQATKLSTSTGDYYIAEWDLVFESEQALREHFENEVQAETAKLATFRQQSTGYEPTYKGVKGLDIKYCVSNSFSPTGLGRVAKSVVVADLKTATQRWERVMNVRFHYDASQDSSCSESSAGVDFAVKPASYRTYACGASKLGWVGGLPGCVVHEDEGDLTFARGVLTIRYDLFGSGSFPGITPVGALMHELGHILGFRHEHPWAPGGCAEPVSDSTFDLTGRRLTSYDQLSVMHYPDPACNGIAGADLKISFLDGVGGRSIYGVPAAWHVPILR